MIPTVTFYSFKGGVGRTAALANAAVYLAREGHVVAALDMDLEAPGLGMWLPPATADLSMQKGLIDLIEFSVEHGRLPEDIGEYLYSARLPRGMSNARVFVLSAGRFDDRYPERLAHIRWDTFFEALDGGAFFHELKSRLATEYGVDRLLVDARTGFSDPAAVAVRSLADLVVVFFRPDSQNLNGLRLVLDDIRADCESGEDAGERYLLVSSPEILVQPGSLKEREQRDRLLDAALTLQLLKPEDEAGKEEWEDAVEDRIARIHWFAELAEASRPVVGVADQNPLSLGYVELGRSIDRRLALRAAEAAAQTPGNWSPKMRSRVLNEDVGDDDGMKDAQLLPRFVRTEQVRKALDLETSFVFGSKGAGKSAIFRYLNEEPGNAFDAGDCPVVIPIHGDVDHLTLLDSSDLPPSDDATEKDFEDFWLAYLATRLAKYAQTGDSVSRGLELHELRAELRIMRQRPDESFNRAAQSALSRAEGRGVLLLIDATERLFGERPFLQGPSFRGLAKAWLQWRSALPTVHFKAFIRDQARLERSGTLIDLSHLQSPSITLKWKEVDAWWFLLRRLLASVDAGPGVPSSITSDLLGRLKSDDHPGDVHLSEIRTALESVFPRKVYVGDNEAPFHRWLLSRVKDGNGAFYPRVLLAFTRECQRIERSHLREAPGESVFDRTTARDAFKKASREHAGVVFQEIGYLKAYLHALGRQPFSPHQVRYREKELIKAFGKIQEQTVEPEAALRMLRELGILRHESGSRWRGEVHDFQIPAIYKYELVTPKGRV